MAIRFRGALNDFSQLEYGYCPPEAVPIKEGDNLENVIMQALAPGPGALYPERRPRRCAPRQRAELEQASFP